MNKIFLSATDSVRTKLADFRSTKKINMFNNTFYLLSIKFDCRISLFRSNINSASSTNRS